MLQTLLSIGLESPIGHVRISATETGIKEVAFVEDGSYELSKNPFTYMESCAEQLKEYFAGERMEFADLPLAIEGTVFQQDVWTAVSSVGFGQTCTYAEVAKEVGSEGGAQAVGQALTRNAIMIIVPCHRVLPAGASLANPGGYASGTERKRWLIEHEGANIDNMKI